MKVEKKRIIDDHLNLLDHGVVDQTVPWPRTGWEELNIRVWPKERRLWIGELSRETMGIVRVVKGDVDG